MRRVWIGISGWTFPGWRGVFYPKGLAQRRELEFASRVVNSIEINGTFYSLQKPESFQAWHDQVPDDFRFAIKAPQFITHIRRLKEVEEPLANFMASGLLCLRRKLGPILWQFPPHVMLKDDRFERFLRLLPHDSESAAALAREHGPKMKDRAWTRAEEKYPIQHAFEFRHPSFAAPDFIRLLKAHGVAFVVAHANKKSPYVEDATADFAYVRLHGEGPKYRKGYGASALREWATKIEAWRDAHKVPDAACVLPEKTSPPKRDVFVYFSNEAKVYSPAGAKKLLQLLGLSEKPAREPRRRRAP
jgi:uncharacterized protein YecE (DUF72 family)